MKLFVKIVLLELVGSLAIVACTRAYVLGLYGWTSATEIAFCAQWFWSRNISFDEAKARSWWFGFPAHTIGAVAGSLLGLWLSKTVLKQ